MYLLFSDYAKENFNQPAYRVGNSEHEEHPPSKENHRSCCRGDQGHDHKCHVPFYVQITKDVGRSLRCIIHAEKNCVKSIKNGFEIVAQELHTV